MKVTDEPARRFSGITAEMRAFFRRLDGEPCPESWPGGDRVAYLKDVLGPLKAFTRDLAERTAGAQPRLALEARVGGSLSWPRDFAPESADCAVRSVRAWDARLSPATSSLLSLDFSGACLRLSLEADDDAAVARLGRTLLDPDEEPRRLAASLLAHGWSVSGPTEAAADPADPPADVLPWLRRDRLVVERSIAWEPWLDEPAFVDEVAARFLEAAPLLALLHRPAPAAASSGP